MADAAHGLSLEPDDPRLTALLGLLRAESGDAAGALADLDRFSRRSGGPDLDRARAEARTRLGQGRQALPERDRDVHAQTQGAGVEFNATAMVQQNPLRQREAQP